MPDMVPPVFVALLSGSPGGGAEEKGGPRKQARISWQTAGNGGTQSYRDEGAESTRSAWPPKLCIRLSYNLQRKEEVL